MEIKIAQSAEELRQVYRLRYNVYVEEMGLNPPEADHSRRMITDPLDATGRILAAFSGGEVVGTVRVNLARDTDMGEWQHLLGMDRMGLFFPDRVSMTTRLLVAPEYRNSTLGVRLSKAVLRLDYDLGTRFQTMCCHERRLGFFHRLGFRQFIPTFDLEGYGESHPLVMVLADTEHLAKVGSFFLSALPPQVDDYGSVNFFYTNLCNSLEPAPMMAAA